MSAPRYTAVQLTGPTTITPREALDGPGGTPIYTEEISGDYPDWLITYEDGYQVIVKDEDFTAWRLAQSVINTPTDIYISPTGDDAVGDGTEANPWRSFEKVLGQMEGKTIEATTVTLHVADGDYSLNEWSGVEYIYSRDVGWITVPGTSYCCPRRISGVAGGQFIIQGEGPGYFTWNTYGLAILLCENIQIHRMKIRGLAGISQSKSVHFFNCYMADAYPDPPGLLSPPFFPAIFPLNSEYVTATECYLAGFSEGAVSGFGSFVGLSKCTVHSNKYGVKAESCGVLTVDNDCTSGRSLTVTGVQDMGGDVFRLLISETLTQDEQDFLRWVKTTGLTPLVNNANLRVLNAGAGPNYLDVDASEVPMEENLGQTGVATPSQKNAAHRAEDNGVIWRSGTSSIKGSGLDSEFNGGVIRVGS